MSARPHHQGRSGERGFVLVAVLWILVALASFTAVYAVYVSDTAVSAAARDEGFLAQGLTTAAVELAALRLLSAPKDKRPTSGQVSFHMNKASVTADFRGERARIDLNSASRELLTALFTVLGAQAEAAGRYADAIVAWRSPNGRAAQEEAYRDAGLDYGPRGGPFVHTQEIWRIPGLPRALMTAALPHFTVYSGRREINMEIADPVVRAAMKAAGGTGEAGEGPVSGDSEDGGVQVASAAGITSQGGDAVRVRVHIAFDNGRQRDAEAVILLNEFEDDPYRVLTWSDDADPAPARTRLTEARP